MNVSIGYENAHTVFDYVNIAAYNANLCTVMNIIRNYPAESFKSTNPPPKVDPSVCKVAENPGTPGTTLATLATSKFPKVRKLVAMNPSTPKKVLGYLMRDRNARVRMACVENPSISLKKILMMTTDSDEEVRDRARELARQRDGSDS